VRVLAVAVLVVAVAVIGFGLVFIAGQATP